MGKLIAFPTARLPARRQQPLVALDVFGELALIERAQLKLFGACATFAVLVVSALQLLAG